jgi:hypothetical protein
MTSLICPAKRSSAAAGEVNVAQLIGERDVAGTFRTQTDRLAYDLSRRRPPRD